MTESGGHRRAGTEGGGHGRRSDRRGAGRRVTWRDQALKNLGVWLAVYPAVLMSSYLFSWLAPGTPLWLEILISTAFTVPLISYVAVPWVERRLAHSRGETTAEFKREEAERSEGGADG